MLWVMSLAGPTLIAVDQIDTIVSASNLLAGTDDTPTDDAEKKARAIIDLLAGGLMDLHELKKRAQTVISCLQVTWPIIKTRAVKSAPHRFEELPVLEPIKKREIVEQIILGRLNTAYAAANFTPPYPTWPFRPEAIDSAIGLLPRQVLIRCQEHRQRCVAAGTVTETLSLVEPSVAPIPATLPSGLDQEFEQQIASADIAGLFDNEREDTLAWELLFEACDLYLKQLLLPETMDAVVKPDPDRKKPSLHARIVFTFHDQGDREQHYCFRILKHSNAIAFQARLKAALTASGIDTALKFRHLFILRRDSAPKGKKTEELVTKFLQAGGKFISPTPEDLRMFVALVFRFCVMPS